jgi:ABC-type multidrug transport system ATPase subunit
LQVSLENIGKRFNREWIFKDMHKEFSSEVRCALLGSNGSGKSTLLQIISGYLTPSTGAVHWKDEQSNYQVDTIFKHVAIASPAMGLYDDFTLRENIAFFQNFKPLRHNLQLTDVAERIELSKHLDKPLKHFSSGMKQRVKLGLAILSDTPLLLLDEPTSHLDANATKWYQSLLNEHTSGRSLFVASNSHEEEIFLCNEQVIMEDFKSFNQ